jgi:5-methylcytosine-specific restriction protein A
VPKPWASSKRRTHLAKSGWQQQRDAKRIMRRQGGVCHVCGQAGADQVDHVVPLSEGGSDDDANKAPIHSEPCHRVKTAAESKRARG